MTPSTAIEFLILLMLAASAKHGRKTTLSLFAGLIVDAAGNRYVPTHAVKNGKRYRYYTSQAAIEHRESPTSLR